MGLQSLLLADEPRPHMLFPQRLAQSSLIGDVSLEAGLLLSDSDSDSGPPFLQVRTSHTLLQRIAPPISLCAARIKMN